MEMCDAATFWYSILTVLTFQSNWLILVLFISTIRLNLDMNSTLKG